MSQVQQEDGNNHKVNRKTMVNAIRAAGIEETLGSDHEVLQLYYALNESKQNAKSEISDYSPKEYNSSPEQRTNLRKEESILKQQNQTLPLKNINLPNAEGRSSSNEESSQTTNQKDNSYALMAKKSPQQSRTFIPSGGRRNKKDAGPKSCKVVNFFANHPNEEDMPLESKRPYVCESPLLFKYNDMTKEIRHNVKLTISENLQKNANLWHSMNMLIIDDKNEILWQTPIKVGIVNDNLDKESSVVEDRGEFKLLKLEQKKTNDTKRTRNTGGVKRRAATLKKTIKYVSSDTEEEFFEPKKQKSDETKEDSDVYVYKDDNNEEKKPTRDPWPTLIDIEDPDVDEIPPSPETGKNGRKKKKPVRRRNPKKLDLHKTATKVSKALDEEKQKTTILDDDKLINQTPMVALKDVEIKPAKIPQRLSSRIKQQCDILKQNNTDEELERKIEEMKHEEHQRKIQFKREEKLRLKIKDEKDIASQLRERKRQMQQGNKYNEILKQKRIENKAGSNMSMQPVVEISDDVSFNDLEVTVPCPICNESFATDAIEAHASECTQFSPNSTDDNVIENKQLKCQTCDSFQGKTSGAFFEHVKICLDKKYKEAEGTVEENSLTSPIRNNQNNETSKLKDISNRKRYR